MAFNLTIETKNAAFSDASPADECARILRHVAQRLEKGELAGLTMDGNGNRVGRFELTETEETK